MGTGEHTGNLREELKKVKKEYKQQILREIQVEQLTYLNDELFKKLRATEKSHRSLMNYITEMHQNLADNFHRTAIEEIWYPELGRYLKKFK